MLNKEKISKIIIQALSEAWADNGHKLTNAMIDSLVIDFDERNKSLSILVSGNKYGIFMDSGVSASRIPFNPGSGAKTSKYIDGLMKYVEMRMGISDEKEKKGIAFAIAHKHKKQGMPSGTGGKGTKWLDFYIKDILTGITEEIVNSELYVNINRRSP